MTTVEIELEDDIETVRRFRNSLEMLVETTHDDTRSFPHEAEEQARYRTFLERMLRQVPND